MALTLMYITNNPDVARIAQAYGVQRIWIDLEAEKYEYGEIQSYH